MILVLLSTPTCAFIPKYQFFPVYLHFVLDLWFEKKVRHWFKGEAYMHRFADDFLVSHDFFVLCSGGPA
jgi:hypothetical protein